MADAGTLIIVLVPSLAEVKKVVVELLGGRSAGICDISREMLKAGEPRL